MDQGPPYFGTLAEWFKACDLRSHGRMTAWVRTPQVPNCFCFFFVKAMFQRLFKRCLQEDSHNCFTYRAATMDTHPTNGLRVAVKDNIAVKGMPLTCASPTLRTYQADYDADVVSFLRQHGAQIVGKTNMDEFGMGSATIHSIHGPTRNAINPRWAAGGSSGGSIVAVALGLCDVGLGSDTGGSIRLPAGCNRVVGFKPTYGRISRHGLVSYAPSMDCIGIAAKTIEQVAQVFDMVKDKGQDSILMHKKASIEGKTKIAVPIELISEQRDQFMQCITAFAEEREMQVELISVPLLDEAVTNYYTIACVEASSTMARYIPGAPFHQITDPLGEVVQRRIESGQGNHGQEKTTMGRCGKVQKCTWQFSLQELSPDSMPNFVLSRTYSRDIG